MLNGQLIQKIQIMKYQFVKIVKKFQIEEKLFKNVSILILSGDIKVILQKNKFVKIVTKYQVLEDIQVLEKRSNLNLLMQMDIKLLLQYTVMLMVVMEKNQKAKEKKKLLTMTWLLRLQEVGIILRLTGMKKIHIAVSVIMSLKLKK